MSVIELKRPLIKREYINKDEFRVDINTEIKRIQGFFNVITEHSDSKIPNKKKPVRFGWEHKDFNKMLQALLPNDDKIIWSNPYKSFRDNLFKVLQDKGVI